MHRFARAFELTVSYFGISLLLLLIVATNTVPTSYAASASATTSSSSCVAPSFYSLTITPASLNTPWSLPLLSTLDGPYVPTVKATGLPPGVILDDQKTVLSAGGSTLHNWVLDGAPTQLGTYTITVTAQNSCGGASTVVTLPINNSNSGQGTALCPTGTMGTYPNCVSSTAATVSFDKSSLSATSTNPTITGTSNTSVVNLTARSSTGNMTSSGPETVSGGRWSAPLSNLMTGIYSLFLYDGSNTLLIPGSLVVMLPSGSASSGTSSPIPTAHVNVQSGVVIPNTTVVSNGSSCVSINSVLQLGSRGSDVFNLQNFLISRGLLAQGSATGYFGAQTRAAVQQFQVQQGIVSSGSESTTGFGLVGAHTRAVIEAACAQVSGATSGNVLMPTPIANITCPAFATPVCPNGIIASVGHDVYGCSLGYTCQNPQAQPLPQQDSYTSPYGSSYVSPSYSFPYYTSPTTPVSCPAVSQPTCSTGTPVSTGVDYNGCSTGYVCPQTQTTVCPTGTTGTYPYCTTTLTCPSGTTGTYPNCVTGSTPTFVAVPISGAAPLTVSFAASNLASGTYGIDFADPTEVGDVIRFFSSPTINTTHTYTTAGTYSVTLSACPQAGNPPGSCGSGSTLISTVAVTVTGPAICTPTGSGIECATGYHAVSGGTDANGCNLASQCVANTTSTDPTTQSITALYWSELGRAPDAAGLAYWVAQVNSGAITLAGVKQDFDAVKASGGD